jgi:hypothetical protein
MKICLYENMQVCKYERIKLYDLNETKDASSLISIQFNKKGRVIFGSSSLPIVNLGKYAIFGCTKGGIFKSFPRFPKLQV